MGELLYKKFLEEVVEEYSLHDVMLLHGIQGLFDLFEDWLVEQDYLKRKDDEYERWTFDDNRFFHE